MESHGRGNPGEGLDLQERKGATDGKEKGGGAGCHRKLLGPQCARLPTGLQRVECSFLVPGSGSAGTLACSLPMQIWPCQHPHACLELTPSPHRSIPCPHRASPTRPPWTVPNYSLASPNSQKNTSTMKKHRNRSQLIQENSRKAINNETDLCSLTDFEFKRETVKILKELRLNIKELRAGMNSNTHSIRKKL